jgi:hypothetical protein
MVMDKSTKKQFKKINQHLTNVQYDLADKMENLLLEIGPRRRRFRVNGKEVAVFIFLTLDLSVKIAILITLL